MITRSELADLVEDWRRILLPEWRVVLKDTPPPGEADDFWAISQTKDDYTELLIHFTDECLGRTRDECEVTIVHELLHALTRPWRKQINGLAGDLSSDAYRRLADERRHEEEQLVDRLARVLVKQRHGGAVTYGTVPDPERTTSWS